VEIDSGHEDLAWWIAYALTAQEGDGRLVVRNLTTNAEIRVPRARDPLITFDNKFVVWDWC
jgi:hypothetical protein